MGHRNRLAHLPLKLSTMERTGFPIMLVASALLAQAACSKGPVTAPERVSISFETLPPAAVKALSPEAEDRVETLDLLIFRAGDGFLEAHARSSSSFRVGASVTAGVPLHWYVIANAPDGSLASYGSEQDFLAGETLLAGSGALTMHAEGDGNYAAGENRLVSGIRLKRYACKVSLLTLSVNWLGAFWQSPPCTLDRIALVNVRGSCPWSGIATGGADDLWYNPSRIDRHDAFVDGFILWEGPVTVPGPDPIQVEIPLYAMPNPSSENGDGGGSWSPRKTRLCLQLTIDGIPQWYRADLPPMQGNRHYVITHLVIDGPGALHPDEAIERAEVTFRLQVLNWDDSWNNLIFEW